MISEKELKKEIKATKRFIKYLEKQDKELSWDEIYGYLDGLEFALKGKLD
jgi:hypothetical protein